MSTPRPSLSSTPSAARWWVHRALTVIVAVAVSIWPSAAPAGAEAPTGFVEGIVLARGTQAPVAGATITLPGVGISTTSRSDGSFAFAEPLSVPGPYRRVAAVVTAPGYGRWTVRGVPVYSNDTLRLRAELRRTAWTHRVLTPQERGARSGRTAPTSPRGGGTCTGWTAELVPQNKIWVYISDDEVSRQYDFRFYVKHVLPNEWIASWDADALGAGAIAAKTYAGYRSMPLHAYSSGPGCADVIDTVADQVFDPTWSAASTDKAVDATFGSVLFRDGGLFLSQYYAGAEGADCAPVTGEYAGRMSQWGTQTCATEGELWPAITRIFYENTRWNYLRNLILNPSAEATALYPYAEWAATTLTREDDVPAYGGTWYLKLAPKTAGKTVAVYQERSFVGTATATYDTQVALRCTVTNADPCSVWLKLTGIRSSGSDIYRTKHVTVPRSGVWHFYEFDPAAFGVGTTKFRFTVTSSGTILYDTARVETQFGG